MPNTRSSRRPPWQTPGPADAYLPNPGYASRRIRLSPEATREVWECTDPTDDEAYLLLRTDGGLRPEAFLYANFDAALEEAMWENYIIVYLKKPGMAVRVIWLEDQLPQRTKENLDLEPVILEPHGDAITEKMLLDRAKFRKIFRSAK